jgi:hypothetical protein
MIFGLKFVLKTKIKKNKMKKLFVTLAILIGSLTTNAQFVQPEPKPIDLKLEQFRKEHAFGTGMQILGAALCGLGYLTQRTNGNLYKPYYALGSAFVLSGTVTKMMSYSNLAIDTQVTGY